MGTTIATGMGTASAEPFATMPAPATVRIERLLPGPIERVWAYLTESDKRRRWFAAGPMDLQPGGRRRLPSATMISRSRRVATTAPARPTASPTR